MLTAHGGSQQLHISEGLVCAGAGNLSFPKGLASGPGRPRVPPASPVVFDVQLVYIPGKHENSTCLIDTAYRAHMTSMGCTALSLQHAQIDVQLVYVSDIIFQIGLNTINLSSQWQTDNASVSTKPKSHCLWHKTSCNKPSFTHKALYMLALQGICECSWPALHRTAGLVRMCSLSVLQARQTCSKILHVCDMMTTT